MTTVNEILSTVLGMEGATMARVGKTNFVMVPVENGYAKVEVKMGLAQNTKNHKAFNPEAAVAEYKAWETEKALKLAEKAARPVTVKGPNPEAQARRDELDARICALPVFAECTATDIMKALEGQVAFTLTAMNVGQAARRLVERGVLTVSTKEGDKKPYYTKA